MGQAGRISTFNQGMGHANEHTGRPPFSIGAPFPVQTGNPKHGQVGVIEHFKSVAQGAFGQTFKSVTGFDPDDFGQGGGINIFGVFSNAEVSSQLRRPIHHSQCHGGKFIGVDGLAGKSCVKNNVALAVHIPLQVGKFCDLPGAVCPPGRSGIFFFA